MAKLKSVRFIFQLPVEEMFNRVKKSVDMTPNNSCTPQRVMAVTIDQGVLSSITEFQEVSRSSESAMRSFQFKPSTFKPIYTRKDMPEDVKSLNLSRCAGTGEASWFIPTAEGSVTPFADIVAPRLVSHNLRLLETV